MTVEALTIGEGERRRAPIEGGPTIEIVRGAARDRRTAVLHVTIPPGGGMPEHDHGASEVVLVPQEGTIRLIPADGTALELVPGSVGVVPIGRRVRLENATAQPARALVIVAPPNFAEGVASWPAAGDATA